MNELSRDALKLIEAARRARPAEQAKGRGRARLLATIGTTSAAAAAAESKLLLSAASATKASLLGVAGKALLLGAGIGLGVGVGVARWLPRAAAPSAPATASASVSRSPARPVPTNEPRREIEQAPAVTASRSARPRDSRTHGEAPSIRQETELLEQAQRALGAGQGLRALVLLNRYDAEFPHGALREEATGARVLALCAAGRQSEGARAAQEFLRSYPSSPLLPRIRSACIENGR